jgi:C1A family cysteine protease
MSSKRRFATGCRKDTYDPRDYQMRHFLRAGPVPDRADHRREMPEIFDQGGAGTCVACASAYYDKSFQERREHAWDLAPTSHRFSPLFVYSQRADHSGDHGMTIREAMRIVNEEGVCTLADMPYVEDAIDTPPTEAQLLAARPFRSKSFARITSIAEAEHYLAENCFVAGLLVHESFMEAPGGRVPMPKRGDPYAGGHALCVVGFDRRRQVFAFVNSWGPGWGQGGFGTIGYDVFLALLMDAWGMVDAPDDR